MIAAAESGSTARRALAANLPRSAGSCSEPMWAASAGTSPAAATNPAVVLQDERRGAGLGAGDHRQRTGQRLERDVGRRVVEGRQHERVGGAEMGLPVGEAANERHAIGHAARIGARDIAHRRGIVPQYDEVRGRCEPGERVDRRSEAGAREVRGGQQKDGRGGIDAQLFEDGGPLRA